MLTTCSRKGWTLEQWKTLPDAEKDTWLAWELRQQQGLADFLSAMLDNKLWSPESVMTLVQLARMGL